MSIRAGFVVSLLFCPAPVAAAEENVAGRIAGVIDSLRGIHLDSLSEAEKDSLDVRLDAAWDVLLEDRKASRKAVRAVLAAEREDSFLIIDLAYLLMAIDPDLMAESAAALERADPNAYPGGYFNVAAGMAAAGCEACLPAVLGMLRLEALNTGIAQHALPVDIDLGLVFTIGQYGDAALESVRAALESEDCVVRGNAAVAIGYLLPAAEPARVAEIALADPCETSRAKAWRALGALGSPTLGALAARRLAADEGPSAGERQAIVVGLSLAGTPEAVQRLQELSGDADGGVASAAAAALGEIEKRTPTLAELRAAAGTASAAERSRTQLQVKRAVRKGRLEFGGARKDLVAALRPADMQLLNEARAAVLNRVSDECLYEYFDLSAAVRVLRGLPSVPGAEPQAARHEPPSD